MASRATERIFSEILDRVRALDPGNSRKWFDELRPLELTGGFLRVGCSDEVAAAFLRQECKEAFTRAAQQVTGHLISLEFDVNHSAKPVKRANRHAPLLSLHPDYTFHNFVVGPSNRLAHASCVAVSHSPGNTYNPLFLYGRSGLGKTHLLHAVCREAAAAQQGTAVQFLSCEDFINRFIKAIQEGDLAGFQSEFRNIDMLVIDDIQFLREREQTQEEFFHTFNALYNNGKQIVLSADSPPGKLPAVEERLVSRFNWGLVARVDSPSYETRIAIVKNKATLRGMSISDDVAAYIARKAQSNIREMEGALTTMYAMSMTSGAEVTLELAQKAIEGQINLAAHNINITDIIEVVTTHFDVRAAELQSKRRSQRITTPRQICMYLARNLTRHSLEEIGGHLGGRDHTTVMYACNKISEAERSDDKTKNLLEELRRLIIARRQA